MLGGNPYTFHHADLLKKSLMFKNLLQDVGRCIAIASFTSSVFQTLVVIFNLNDFLFSVTIFKKCLGASEIVAGLSHALYEMFRKSVRPKYSTVLWNFLMF